MAAFRSILAAAAAATASAAIAADEVTSLPGWTGALPSKFYSGYLSTGVQGAQIHYMYVQSTAADPTSVPVTLWLNGGPGCSSMEGAFAESGPLWVNDDGVTLSANENSWINVTSMLFFEAPACVGYSYSTVGSCNWDDNSTAFANANALGAFFAGFSELLPRDFYITGESYAGIYVPTLAAEVVRRNNGGMPGWTKLPIKGVAVGNGCLGNDVGVCGGSDTDVVTNVPMWRGHSLISQKLWADFETNCACASCDPSAPSLACEAVIAAAHIQVGDVNIYDILAPCEPSASRASNAQGRALVRHLVRSGKWNYTLPRAGGPDECIGGAALSNWFNTPAVAAALHVNTKLVGTWSVCTNNPLFNYDSTQPDESKTIYPVLLKNGLRVLIYNGDEDACVPFYDNERWTDGMNLQVKSDWHQWTSGGQNAGYCTTYAPATGSFQYCTVKGAGHMVPEYRPSQAWTLFNAFFSGQQL